MAYKNYFKPERMTSQFDESYLHAVYVQSAAANVEAFDGDIVSVGDLAPDPLYADAYAAAGVTDVYTPIHTRNAELAADGEAGFIAVIDLADVATKTGRGGTIRNGITQIGLSAEPGVPVRARRLNLLDVYVIGEENTSAALTVGQFATAATGKHAPAATLPATGFGAKVAGKFVVSQGVDGDVANGNGVTSYKLDVKSL